MRSGYLEKLLETYPYLDNTETAKKIFDRFAEGIIDHRQGTTSTGTKKIVMPRFTLQETAEKLSDLFEKTYTLTHSDRLRRKPKREEHPNGKTYYYTMFFV